MAKSKLFGISQLLKQKMNDPTENLKTAILIVSIDR